MNPVILAICELRQKQIAEQLISTPEHVLIETKRRQDIEAHNAMVAKKKAAKRR